MGFVEYAKKEFKLLGELVDYGESIKSCMLEVLAILDKQEHSGASIGLFRFIFDRLVQFKPLTPLTGEDDEWVEVETGVWQNKRCPFIFKDKEKAWDLSRKGEVITFPYRVE